MAVTAPEWLTNHGASLKPSADGRTWYVFLNGEPLYAVTERPVTGTFGCAIKQTNSGRPIPCPGTAATRDGAVLAGLEDLRKYLGW